ncbi:glycosyltransferase family 2 protein [Nitrosomonas sp. Nm58]|jgi:hypothetical protein|uniref:glycosyltransferase family 2 protein n=1 Tax=Nitrosomonas sp. Nm58 TaxID=200126 RepID=UPI00089AEA93|nr:glycosyltransferase family 2 protein [Nitrosomonas sp. Nm58]SDY03461.1 Glycosyl transferase family 2 [Nitrosomonas sp. Nm58]
MIVHIYSLCWNEERMLPYYFRHYDAIADRFFIFDDASTDASLDILGKQPKVEIDRFHKQSNSLVASATVFNDNIWKRSRNKADWVILCSMDEHLYHANLLRYLKQCQDAGITAIPAEGYQMVSDSFPDAAGRLCDLITRGMRYKKMDKLCIFNPDAIEETNFIPGRHRANPTGRVVLPEKRDLKLLHYKYLGLDYLVTRYAELRTGLSQVDIEKKWGHQYLLDKERIEKEFLAVQEASSEIPLSTVSSQVKAMGRIEFQLRKFLERYTELRRILKKSSK